MDKPSKTRRRRSIRKLRASSGFHSPPLPAAPYGSAWIDHDLETNMDNLVLSLSQLQSNDDDKDSGESEIPPKCIDPSISMAASAENFSHVMVDKNTSLTYAEDGVMQEEAPLTKSNLHSLKSYESFSFSPDMPLDGNSPREGCHFDSCIANVAQSTPSQFSMCRRLLERNQELSNHKELLRDEENEHNSIHCTNTNGLPEYESLDYLELEEAYTDLSLNFSPVPEQDETIGCLVGSLYDNFDVSFSPQGVRPDTPELSSLIPFNTADATKHTFPGSLHYTSPTNEIPKSFSHSEFLEATYTLNSTIEESPATRNDSHDVDFFNRNINSTSELFSNVYDGSCIGDESKDLCQPQSIGETASLQALECDSSQSHIMKTGNICDGASEGQCDGADCFNRFVGDMETELERIGSKKVAFSEKVTEDTSTVPGTNVSDLSALKHCDDLCQEDAVKDKGKTMVDKQKRRSKRRSSRQFTIKEFSVAFEEFEPVVNNSIPVCQDTNSNLHFQGILESEKENIKIDDRYLDLQSDSNVDFSEGLTNVHAHSDVNQNQKDSGKKKRGRRSGSFSKGKTKSNSQKNAVKLASDDSVVLAPYNENLTMDALRGDQISHSTTTENREETSSTKSGSGATLTILAEDDDHQNENSSSMRGSKARRNRKSWGDVSSRRAAAVKHNKVTHKEKQPQVEICHADGSHLEQIYSKQKYVPVKPQSLETIKEVPNTDMFFGKQKKKRCLIFPEDYIPTTAKLRQRRTKATKQLKKCLGHTPIDYEEFLIRLNAIQLDLDSSE